MFEDAAGTVLAVVGPKAGAPSGSPIVRTTPDEAPGE